MSASNDPELNMQGEDINAYSVEFNDSAEQAVDDTSLVELKEPTPRENGQELTSEEVPEFDFITVLTNHTLQGHYVPHFKHVLQSKPFS